MKVKSVVSRREFLAAGVLGATGLLTSVSAFRDMNFEDKKDVLLYVGTYTEGTKSDGIYIYRFNTGSGELAPYKTVRGVVNPSFLILDKDRRFLYSVDEVEDYQGKKSGAVFAFAIDRDSGDLRLLNKQPSLGGSPCQVAVSNNGRFVLAANYSGGNMSVFPVQADGSLGPNSDFVQHNGFGPNRDRQLAAHVHSVTLDHKNHFAMVCDLGIDKVMIYRFDDKTGKVVPNTAQPAYVSKPGAGPRHFAFHQNGKFAFVINELDSTVSALEYDGGPGTLKEINTLSTLPPEFNAANTCADIHISPDGKFLYGSNRGLDSIAVFKIDEKTGRISYVDDTPTGGKTPRNFVIDPSGNFLLAANQTTNNIVVFSIDRETGRLAATGKQVSVPAPVCLKF